MPTTDQTLQLTADLRVYIASEADEATRALVAAWARTWSDLQREFQAAALDLIAMAEGDTWPSAWQIQRAERAKSALAYARLRLGQIAKAAGVDIIDRTNRVIDSTPGWESRIVASGLPEHMTTALDKFLPSALDSIVARTTQRITSLYGKIPAEAYRALQQALIRGVALGDNPRTVAARLVRQLEHAWNAGLSRALLIARTEMLDAHRAAAAAHHAANTDVLKGWRWQCSLSERTCPACLAKHGTTYPLTEGGPNGHQNCRCSRSPVVRTWREMGIDLPEPPDLFPDARDWFDGLPAESQVRIMGTQRLAALQSGLLKWDDMAALRRTPDWRDSWGVRPLTTRQQRLAA